MQREMIRLLESLLESEMAALDTYDQALQEVYGMEHVRRLCELRRDHEFAAYALRVLLARYSGVGNIDEPGLWPEPSNGNGRVHDGVRLLGTCASLAALKLGEESGVRTYMHVLSTGRLAPEAKLVIERQILPRCRDHIGTLDAMIEV